MKRWKFVASSLLTAFTLLASVGVAGAEEARVTGPNRAMLKSGVWTLGVGYVPALIVAIESPLPADRQLFIPVAGPWLDYANRDCDDCDNETLNKVLLVADGVVQGAGALQIVGSFLFVETRSASGQRRTTTAAEESPRLRFAPARLAPGGYGLVAHGAF